MSDDYAYSMGGLVWSPTVNIRLLVREPEWTQLQKSQMRQGAAMPYLPTLQQLWIGAGEYGERREEWRDVPIVENSPLPTGPNDGPK